MSSTPRFVSLQHRDFRLLWAGQFFSSIGTQMHNIAIAWNVFELTRGQVVPLDLFNFALTLDASALALGGLALMRIGPLLGFSLLGGLAADLYDRRLISIFTQGLQMVIAAVLALLTFAGLNNLAILYIITAISAAADAFDEPARQAMVPHLVPAEHLTNAMSLYAILFYFGTVFGPVIAGLMIDATGVGPVYAANAFSFIAVVVGLGLMRYHGQQRLTQRRFGWAPIREGLQFTTRSRILWSSVLLDFMATLFGSVRTLLPIVAVEIFGLGPTGYGLLATAQPVGAVITGLVLGARADIRRQGLALLWGAGLYGLATALFGLTNNFWLAYFFFAFTGVGDTISTAVRATMRQVIPPDRIRGRVTSAAILFAAGGPQLGELEAGVVAAALGAPFAIVTGGVATVLFVLYTAWRYPDLRAYTGAPDQIEANRQAAALPPEP